MAGLYHPELHNKLMADLGNHRCMARPTAGNNRRRNDSGKENLVKSSSSPENNMSAIIEKQPTIPPKKPMHLKSASKRPVPPTPTEQYRNGINLRASELSHIETHGDLSRQDIKPSQQRWVSTPVEQYHSGMTSQHSGSHLTRQQYNSSQAFEQYNCHNELDNRQHHADISLQGSRADILHLGVNSNVQESSYCDPQRKLGKQQQPLHYADSDVALGVSLPGFHAPPAKFDPRLAIKYLSPKCREHSPSGAPDPDVIHGEYFNSQANAPPLGYVTDRPLFK